MASISPSTLIFTFCLTRELQFVVGTPTLGQILIGGKAVLSAYVLASGLPPRTLLYTVVPDSAFCAAQQNSGPGAGPAICL